MPTVLIWLPEGANLFGHAALRTDKYHISFWPDRGKHFRFSETSITGRLHFHEHLDWVEEGSRENPRGPNSRHAIVNVTNEAINGVYEEFLRYNQIDPEEVTLEAANRHKDKTMCCRTLPLTRHSVVGDVIVDKKIEKSYSDLLFFLKRCLTPGWGNISICQKCIGQVTTSQSTFVRCPFYHKPQSCVSICFNLIEMADTHPLVSLVEARNNTRKTLSSRFVPTYFLGGDGICLEITVPNFDQHVVQKYWQKNCERVHYDANDFQKRSRFLMMSETVFKKACMVAPTILFIAWLHEFFNLSFFDLSWLTWIIHWTYFLSLYAGMTLFPSFRLKKPVPFIICFLIIFVILFHISYSTKTYSFVLKVHDILKFVAVIYRYFIYFFFVNIFEGFLRFFFDKFID